jgi:hypothetical protein
MCRSCARSVHDPLTRDYRGDCPGCTVRQLAHMPADEREKQLLKLQHLCGPGAVKRVREDVRIEMARIKQLRGERAKERT